MAELQVLNGPLQWKTCKLSGPRFLIGRSDTCHLLLTDGWVSREHAVIIESGPGEFMVQDLDSENGIYVNGERVKDSKLKHSDVLRIGRTEMRLFHPAEDESGLDLAALGRRSTIHAPSVPSSGDAGDLDMTIHDPGRGGGSQVDQRNRLRRLERLLNEKEEDNSRLATENAVLKRALAREGLIDPQTGHVDLGRLAAAAPQEALPEHALSIVKNPEDRIAWPQADGAVLPARSGSERAFGAYRLGIVGLGRAGVRLAGAFHRLGWSRVVAMSGDEDVLNEAGAESTLLLPSGLDDVRAARGAADALRGELRDQLSATIGEGSTFRLLTAGLGGSTGVGFVPVVTEVLRELDPERPCGLLLSTPSSEAMADDRRSEATEDGLAELRLLHDASKLRPFVLFDEARLTTALQDGSRVVHNDTVAGLLDLFLRAASLPALKGGLTGGNLSGVLDADGMSALGFAAARSVDAQGLEEAVDYVFADGWLCGTAGSRGRVALALVMIGQDTLAGDPAVVDRISATVGKLEGPLPQADVDVGVYGDKGDGVRIAVWVGGLPFPESLNIEGIA